MMLQEKFRTPLHDQQWHFYNRYRYTVTNRNKNFNI